MALLSFCSKPFQQVILDYDYTFTTPYCGSETIEMDMEKVCALGSSVSFAVSLPFSGKKNSITVVCHMELSPELFIQFGLCNGSLLIKTH